MKLINFTRDLAKYSDSDLDTVIRAAVRECLAEHRTFTLLVASPCQHVVHLCVCACVRAPAYVRAFGKFRRKYPPRRFIGMNLRISVAPRICPRDI